MSNKTSIELYIELLNKVNPKGLKGNKIEPLCEEDAKLLLEYVSNELAVKQESELLSICINMWNFSCAKSTNTEKTPIDIECLESLKLGDMSKKSLAEFLKSYGFGSFDAYFWITLIYSYVNSTDGSIGSYYSNNQNSLNSKKFAADKERKLSTRIKSIDNELKEYLVRKAAEEAAQAEQYDEQENDAEQESNEDSSQCDELVINVTKLNSQEESLEKTLDDVSIIAGNEAPNTEETTSEINIIKDTEPDGYESSAKDNSECEANDLSDTLVAVAVDTEAAQRKQENIAEALTDEDKASAIIKDAMKKAEKKIKEAEKEAEEIIKKAQREAKKEAEGITKEAENQKSLLLKKARETAEEYINEVKKDSKARRERLMDAITVDRENLKGSINSSRDELNVINSSLSNVTRSMNDVAGKLTDILNSVARKSTEDVYRDFGYVYSLMKNALSWYEEHDDGDIKRFRDRLATYTEMMEEAFAHYNLDTFETAPGEDFNPKIHEPITEDRNFDTFNSIVVKSETPGFMWNENVKQKERVRIAPKDN